MPHAHEAGPRRMLAAGAALLLSAATLGLVPFGTASAGTTPTTHPAPGQAGAVLTAASPPPATFAEPPCGALSAGYDPAALPQYDHVVVLMEENLGYTEWAPTQMPFFTQLAGQCGSLLNMHAATHP